MNRLLYLIAGNTRRQYRLVLFLALLLSFFRCPLFEVLFDDKLVFEYAGMAMHKGALPYRDFFDHKPPLIFFFNYWGQFAGRWGLWIMDVTLVLAATHLFFKAAIRFSREWGWWMPVLFNLLLRSTMSLGTGMTREYTAVFTLLLISVLLLQYRWRWYWAGLLTAAVFLMQQEQVLGLLPWIGYFLFTESYGRAGRGRRLLQNLTGLSTGFFLLSAILLAYFWRQGILYNLVETAFLFNTGVYIQKASLLSTLFNLHRLMARVDLVMVTYTTIGWLVLAFFTGARRQLFYWTAVAGFMLSFAAEIVSHRIGTGHDYVTYLLPLSASMPVALLVALHCSGLSARMGTLYTYLCIGLGMAGLVIGQGRNLLYLADERYSTKPAWAACPEYAYLKEQRLQDGDLYIMNNSDLIWLYNDLKIQSPSRWIYHFFWIDGSVFDMDGQVFKTILSDLEKHQTRYVLDAAAAHPFTYPLHRQLWAQYLLAHYRLVAAPVHQAGYTFWERVPVPR